MIGRCPHCGIKLKEPPFNWRQTNEVLLTLKYRELVENKIQIIPIGKKGYCEICNATLEDVEEQLKTFQKKITH